MFSNMQLMEETRSCPINTKGAFEVTFLDRCLSGCVSYPGSEMLKLSY